MVEAGVGQLQAEGVLAVDATTDGISGLTIGEALDELEHGGQGEPGGGGGRLAAGGEGVGELIVAEEQAEFLGDAKAGTIRCQTIRCQFIIIASLEGQFGVSSSLLLPLHQVGKLDSWEDFQDRQAMTLFTTRSTAGTTEPMSSAPRANGICSLAISPAPRHGTLSRSSATA